MKTILILTAVAALFSAVYFSRSEISNLEDNETQKEFFKFIMEFNRNYISNSEFNKRYTEFKNTLKEIQRINSRNTKGMIAGITKFADWTSEEFASILTLDTTGYVPKLPDNLAAPNKDHEDIDWRNKNGVQKVKDQGACGSCWAFSAQGAVEGAHFVDKKQLVDFAEQYLVSCNHDGIFPFKNMGCSGGQMNRAFSFLTKNNNVFQDDYEYKAQDYDQGQECKKSITYAPNSKLADYWSIAEDKGDSFDNLLTRLAERPVAVAVNAGEPNLWKNYKGGVMEEADCAGQSLDHGVLLVGLENDKDGPLLIVKNSWGSRWGREGFVYIRATGVACGIRKMASYPLFIKQ